jgi:hypothetical protein
MPCDISVDLASDADEANAATIGVVCFGQLQRLHRYCSLAVSQLDDAA